MHSIMPVVNLILQRAKASADTVLSLVFTVRWHIISSSMWLYPIHFTSISISTSMSASTSVSIIMLLPTCGICIWQILSILCSLFQFIFCFIYDVWIGCLWHSSVILYLLSIVMFLSVLKLLVHTELMEFVVWLWSPNVVLRPQYAEKNIPTKKQTKICNLLAWLENKIDVLLW